VNLPRSREALARAGRLLDHLAGHAHDTVALRDHLPYVLDLLAGVTRMIDSESKGRRTPQFGQWWATVDCSTQAIQEMRNAELKRLESTTTLDVDTRTAVRAADYPDLNLADGDTLTRISWVFVGGAFDGQNVFTVLRDYLQQVTELLEQAERKLAT
jgi:hypothetical protein